MTNSAGGRTAIILVGGKSRRMGNDKALLNCPEGTIVERIINQLGPHFDEIIISSSEPGKFEFLNYKIAMDEKQGKGPLMGILAGLRISSNSYNSMFMISWAAWAASFHFS